MHLNTFLDVLWLLVQMVSWDTRVMVIRALGWGLAMVFQVGWGERRKGPVSLLPGSRDIHFSKVHSIPKVCFPITIYIPEE